MKYNVNSYKVEVTTYGDAGKFASNGLRFVSVKDAERYGDDLFLRWTAVEDWRVAESEDAPNTAYDEDGRRVRIGEEEGE